MNFNQIKKLNLPKEKFAIFGSGPLAIRNIRELNDIDLIVKKDVWNELSKKYPTQGLTNNLIKIGNIEIWKDWLNLTDKIEEMIDNSETINGLPFVKLNYLVEWKKSMGRKKDKKDIKLVEEYLKSKS